MRPPGIFARFMKLTPLLLLFILFSATAIAQNRATVRGKLIDSIGKQSLKDASVSLLDMKDSTAEAFTIAKEDGSFEIKRLDFGDFLLSISFLGYEHLYKPVHFSKDAPELNLGTIYLSPVSKDLGDVTVTVSPVVIKKDTVEFNAGSFTTKPNAVVEDLLKKLPGIEVDKNGTIEAQGERVQRVLVDGKRFFGNDPKLATRNLPPDVVNKIQVFDDKSDQAKFSGFDDGVRIKTINITTKKKLKDSYFGKAIAGTGSSGTYNANISANRWSSGQQISVTGQANNINQQNFSGPATQAGDITTLAGGLNYRDAWDKNTDAYGSYFYNNVRNTTARTSLTQNILSLDSSTFNDQDLTTVARNNNHRVNFNIEKKIDSNNSLVFRPDLSFQDNTTDGVSTTVTTGLKGTPIYTSAAHGTRSNTGYNIGGSNLQLRHRFKKKFRTMSLDLNISGNANTSDNYRFAVNTFYQPVSKTDTINQHSIGASHSFNFSPTLSYTEPIGKNEVLEFNYNYGYSFSHSENNTYSIDAATHKYNVFDSLFSNAYDNTTISNRVSINYRIQNVKFNFGMGSGMQFTDLMSINTTKNINISHGYTTFTPTLNFQYNFSKFSNFRVNYSGRTGQPSVTQLQPLTTTSDSINFQVGNPALKPQFTHGFNLFYYVYNPSNQNNFSASVNASAVVNDIQGSITQNPNGGKTSTYVNLDGTYNISGYFNYSFPLRRPKSNLNISSSVNYSQSQTLVDGLSNFTRSTSFGETVRWNTNLKNTFDMNFRFNVNYYTTRYSLQPTYNSNYFTQSLSTDFTFYTKNGWIVATDFEYTYSGNHAPGYNTSIPLLNPSIAKQFLKNKAGELRLAVFDLLNQNVSITHSVSANTIQDSRTNVLSRYAMLTFTYNLKRVMSGSSAAKMKADAVMIR